MKILATILLFISAASFGQPIPPPVVYPIAVSKGGTGASLADPNADRILFWDDSAGAVTWLTAGSGLSISGTTISAAGATPGGSSGQIQYNDGGSFGGLAGSGVTAGVATFGVDDAATNSSTAAPLVIRHNTSGSAAAGFGVKLPFSIENSAGSNTEALGISAYLVAANGSETASRILIRDSSSEWVSAQFGSTSAIQSRITTRMCAGSLCNPATDDGVQVKLTTGIIDFRGAVPAIFRSTNSSGGFQFHPSGNEGRGGFSVGTTTLPSSTAAIVNSIAPFPSDVLSTPLILEGDFFAGKPNQTTRLLYRADTTQVAYNDVIVTDRTTSSYDADFSVGVVYNGALAERLRITSAGHVITSGPALTSGNLSSCGTSPSISGNDSAGIVTLGSGGITSCVVTFAVAYGSAPVCTITPADAVTAAATPYITSATGSLTINFLAIVASGTVHYRCAQAA